MLTSYMPSHPKCSPPTHPSCFLPPTPTTDTSCLHPLSTHYTTRVYETPGCVQSLLRMSSISPLWEGGLGVHFVSLPVNLYSRHAGLLQLFQSSKDPPVFSSKESFDVLNDKARHHGGCVGTAPSRHPGGAAAWLSRFWPSEVFCFSSMWAALLSELPPWPVLSFLGKAQATGRA